MAIRRIVLAFAAVLLVGCTAGSPPGSDPAGRPAGAAPAGLPALDPTALVGRWQVEQAAGEEPGAVLIIAAGGMSLWRRCGMVTGSWKAAADGLFTGLLSGGSQSCVLGAGPGAGWLRQAAGYRFEDGRPVLLDGRGRPVARLRPGGRPAVPPGVSPSQAEPPTVTGELRRALRPPAPVPPGLRTVPAAELVGPWIPVGARGARPPYLDLLGDGRVAGSDGCNGQSGRWTGGARGALVAVTGPQTLVACPGAPVGSWLATAGRAGLAGDLLVLLDPDGAELGRLRRGEDRPGAR